MYTVFFFLIFIIYLFIVSVIFTFFKLYLAANFCYTP